MKVTNTIQRYKGTQSGFTLIELLIVVAMLAVLSAIAIPSYNKYFLQNAEDTAVARMKTLELELEKWRATSLTYKGFMPKKSAIDANGDATLSYIYDDSNNKVIYVPEGSTDTDYLYKITLDDGTTDGKSLTPTKALDSGIDTSVGNQWRMIAVPNSDKNSTLKHAENYLVTSGGVQCKTTVSNISFDATKTDDVNCGLTGVETW